MYGYNYGTNANSNYFNNYNSNYIAQPAQDERIWVQNETSAEAYLVAPNGFVRLWDSSRPVYYEKRADATGRPLPLECYSYAKIEPRKAVNSGDGTIDYQAEIDAIIKRIEALERGNNNEISKSNADDAGIPEV